jgi:hypothetical protein
MHSNLDERPVIEAFLKFISKDDIVCRIVMLPLEEDTRQFNVAPISAAIRYAELSKHAVIAEFSDRRNVRWWRETRTKPDGLWLESRQPVSEDSIVYHGEEGPTWKPTLEPVPLRIPRPTGTPNCSNWQRRSMTRAFGSPRSGCPPIEGGSGTASG